MQQGCADYLENAELEHFAGQAYVSETMVKLMADFATVDPNPQFKFNLRGWLFYHFVKFLTPDLSDPKLLAETIRKDRARGPSKPPRNLLAEPDFRESAETGIDRKRVG